MIFVGFLSTMNTCLALLFFSGCVVAVECAWTKEMESKFFMSFVYISLSQWRRPMDRQIWTSWGRQNWSVHLDYKISLNGPDTSKSEVPRTFPRRGDWSVQLHQRNIHKKVNVFLYSKNLKEHVPTILICINKVISVMHIQSDI